MLKRTDVYKANRYKICMANHLHNRFLILYSNLCLRVIFACQHKSDQTTCIFHRMLKPRVTHANHSLPLQNIHDRGSEDPPSQHPVQRGGHDSGHRAADPRHCPAGRPFRLRRQRAEEQGHHGAAGRHHLHHLQRQCSGCQSLEFVRLWVSGLTV